MGLEGRLAVRRVKPSNRALLIQLPPKSLKAKTVISKIDTMEKTIHHIFIEN